MRLLFQVTNGLNALGSSNPADVKNEEYRQAKNALAASNFLLQKHPFSPETASRVASVLTRMKNPENFNSIISFLKENDFSKSQLERVVKTNPRLLSASPEKTIKPKIMIFQDWAFLPMTLLR
ncbi:uncharacterized protein Fot_42537 [Forsythia ovata]|uniref:Uncharacterized protein n=1 Tax=Forsythia ovata TaxID=205694 RepID=A0ABD1RLG4_9LAMI